MNTVHPIKDKETVRAIAVFLKEQSERDFLMFLLGVHLGYRISDILKLRVKDLYKRNFITIKQQKTSDSVNLAINRDLRNAIDHYCSGRDENEFIMRSRNSINKPISRQRAYQILINAGRAFGLDSISCHVMRKTFGYHLYKQTHSLELVRIALGQKSEASTRHYIGLDAEDVNNAVLKLHFL